MIAGKGIVHSEIPGSKTEDSIGLQLWINLPSKDKMIEPYYIDKKKEEIPNVEQDGVHAMVLSGEVFGQKGVINEFRTPVDYIDFNIKEGKEFHKNLNVGWNTFILVYKGHLTIQEKEVNEGEAVFFELEKTQEAKV